MRVCGLCGCAARHRIRDEGDGKLYGVGNISNRRHIGDFQIKVSTFDCSRGCALKIDGRICGKGYRSSECFGVGCAVNSQIADNLNGISLSRDDLIRQARDTTADGQFLRKPRAKRGAFRPTTMESSFEDTKPYVLTELGKQFVHYAMSDVVRRIETESDTKSAS